MFSVIATFIVMLLFGVKRCNLSYIFGKCIIYFWLFCTLPDWYNVSSNISAYGRPLTVVSNNHTNNSVLHAFARQRSQSALSTAITILKATNVMRRLLGRGQNYDPIPNIIHSFISKEIDCPFILIIFIKTTLKEQFLTFTAVLKGRRFGDC